jgi:hypothetical protein
LGKAERLDDEGQGGANEGDAHDLNDVARRHTMPGPLEPPYDGEHCRAADKPANAHADGTKGMGGSLHQDEARAPGDSNKQEC